MGGKRGKRVRVITDPVKYRRHRLKKLARLLLRILAWVLALLLGLCLFWYVLGFLLRPPQE